jgi:hypothetical protein
MFGLERRGGVCIGKRGRAPASRWAKRVNASQCVFTMAWEMEWDNARIREESTSKTTDDCGAQRADHSSESQEAVIQISYTKATG